MSGEPTRVHKSAFVGPGVELGVGVVVGPFAVLLGPTRIHDHVRVGPGAHIGGAPEISGVRQNDPWDGDLDHHEIVVGQSSVLRDGVVIHHGSVNPTVIGERCWLFSRVYVAHDVVVGDDVTLSAGVSLGGHTSVRIGANLGLNVCVHQRRHIGAMAMVGMGTPVTRDVPPFAKAYGVPARIHGVNRFGMTKFGIPDSAIDRIEGLLREGSQNASGFDSSDAASDVASAVVRSEIAWWRALENRRPMVPA